jgi:uncharacterized protein YkwD
MEPQKANAQSNNGGLSRAEAVTSQEYLSRSRQILAGESAEMQQQRDTEAQVPVVEESKVAAAEQVITEHNLKKALEELNQAQQDLNGVGKMRHYAELLRVAMHKLESCLEAKYYGLLQVRNDKLQVANMLHHQ